MWNESNKRLKLDEDEDENDDENKNENNDNYNGNGNNQKNRHYIYDYQIENPANVTLGGDNDSHQIQNSNSAEFRNELLNQAFVAQNIEDEIIQHMDTQE